jgi:hypothetical protein
MYESIIAGYSRERVCSIKEALAVEQLIADIEAACGVSRMN